jgi:hypothetical protein
MRQTVAALFILFAVNAVVADDFKASDGVTLHYRSVGKGDGFLAGLKSEAVEKAPSP